ncbi:PD-(D/E)XK nuclease family protein [Hathewaya massiliensis]|uniref:PD-(D/E)XK nuclease family protein n=1 Tax=Hathewaya massiliensis TaxID=1964382 RepID=UPI001156CAC3|nr:PD-(D/E)XK nuclease family protein [Hathewaya massiliensis]
MGIRIIYGRSGSGKTSFVIDEIKKKYKSKDENKSLILIVPEQLTFQTEKKLVDEIGFLGKGIDVLSFKRMAYRVFKEVGGVTRRHMETSGKTMLLYKIIEELKEDLKVYSLAAKQKGFVSTLGEIICEFKRYNIAPEDLNELKDNLEENTFIYNKISDISLIYSKFEEVLHKGYIDPDEDLTILKSKIWESSILKDTDIWIDEFSGFTPQQYLILEELIKNNCNLNITLNMDYDDSKSPTYREIFSPIIYTEEKLIKLAEKLGKAIEEPVSLSNKPSIKFKNSTELSYLENNYFAYPFKPYENPVYDIGVFKAMNIYSEVEHLATSILHLCREKGVKFSEIAVITRELDIYENLIKSIFNEYKIPYFIDEKKDITSNNLIVFITSLMEILGNNWNYESVFRYLKTNLTGIEKKNIDLLENYALSSGIKGKKSWTDNDTWFKTMSLNYGLKYSINKFLKRVLSSMESGKRGDYLNSLEESIKDIKTRAEEILKPSTLEDKLKIDLEEKLELISEDEILNLLKNGELYEIIYLFDEAVAEEEFSPIEALLNEIRIITKTRDEFTKPLIEFSGKLKGKNTGSKLCIELFNFLESIKVRERIELWVGEFQEHNNIEQVNEYSRIWNLVIELLDQVVEVLGEDYISLSQFSKILTLGFKDHKMGFIPQALQEVIVSSVERLRGHNIKYLFLIGVNDGVFPQINNKEGIFTDNDRIFLKEKGVELAKDTRTAAFEEQYLIYTTLTLGSEYLRVSYPIADHEGKALRPSIIISRLKAIFPKIEEESNIIEEKEEDLIVSTVPTFNNFIEKLNIACTEQELSEVWRGVFKWFYKEPYWRENLNNIIEAFSYSNQEETLEKNKVSKLYGENKVFSVSRVESYIRCPFAYFVKYGLKAKERKIFSLTPPDLGTFMHKVLDSFSRNVEEKYTWDIIDRNLTKEIIENVSKREMDSYTGNVFKRSSKYEYFGERIKRVLIKSAGLIVEHMQRGGFEPLGYEIGFGMDKEGYSPIELELSTGEKVKLVGKIDRVDKLLYEDEEYFRVIDYKSGNKDFKLWEVYYGLQIQLLTYLDAILEKEEEIEKFPVFPAGILYFKIDNPIVKHSSNLSDEEIEEEIMKALKMKGLIIADTKIVKEMDREIEGASLILPVGFKKDGDFTKSSKVATREQFELLREHVKNKLLKACEKMIEGDIGIKPCKTGAGTACDYCEYGALCAFDLSIKDNQYDILKEKKDEEVWRLLEKEKEERENGGN